MASKLVPRLLGFLCVTLLAGSAHAGEYFGMVRPYFYNDGLYLDPVGGQRAAVPACATRGTMRLVEDPASLVHKQKYAMLLGLWLSGRNLTLKGSGACTTEGDEIMSVVIPN